MHDQQLQHINALSYKIHKIVVYMNVMAEYWQVSAPQAPLIGS